RHVEIADVVSHVDFEDVYTARERDRAAAAALLQRVADPQSRRPQKPSHPVRRLRFSSRGPGEEPPPDQDVHRGADGSDRAGIGRQQGLPPEECDRRRAHAPVVVRARVAPGRTMSDSVSVQVQQQGKIIPFDELPRLRNRFADKKIVQCHGAFDLVHIGHLIHFEEAKALGDVLVVTITADKYITKKRSITFSEDHRARQVATLQIVDYVVLVQEPSALSAIEALHPDVYVKGPEYADLVLDKSRSIFHEMRVLESYGGRIHFTAGETFSSTKLSHFLLAAPEAAQQNPLLRNERILFRDLSKLGFKLEQLKQFLARASTLRVCIVGETIVDEWVDVALTNLSTQSRCVAGLETARVRQIGGVGIIASHLANFVQQVDCFTNGPVPQLPRNVRVSSLA